MDVRKNEVERYLKEIKEYIKNKKYIVASRDKNEKLFREYLIDEVKREEILLKLRVEDFCQCVENEHPKFAHEVLYVFGKDVKLLSRYGSKEKYVSLYIKFNKLKNNCIVISFHEQEFPMNYMFKERVDDNE